MSGFRVLLFMVGALVAAALCDFVYVAYLQPYPPVAGPELGIVFIVSAVVLAVVGVLQLRWQRGRTDKK
jgi:hypothetical protein